MWYDVFAERARARAREGEREREYRVYAQHTHWHTYGTHTAHTCGVVSGVVFADIERERAYRVYLCACGECDRVEHACADLFLEADE